MKTMYIKMVKCPISSNAFMVKVEEIENGEVYKCTFTTYPNVNAEYPSDSFIKWISNREEAIELAVDHIRNHK